MSRSFVALGANLGDRQTTLDRAILRLRAEPNLRVVCASSYYETAPVGGPPGQGNYLNAVVEIITSLAPESLLDRLLTIEKDFGRVRTEANAPRTLDLDILFYDDLIRSTPDLVLPHPRLHERQFVLVPLAEIAPDIVHPLFKCSALQLLQQTASTEAVPRKIGSPKFRQDKDLAGLRAVVTGSTSGIGKAIVLELARGGASVIVHGHRSTEAIDKCTAEARELGVEAHGLQLDLRDQAGFNRFIAEAWDRWNGIDIWINNAGADLLTNEAINWTFEKKWEELLAVDVTATMLLSRAIGARMRAGRSGVILTMGWDQAETGMEGESGQLFGAAKGAIMAFTRSLAKTLAPEVRVNALAPGWIKTDWGEGASDEWQSRVRRETPLKRWGLAEDVAATARWLVSPAASFITGQTIRINGGVVC